MVNPLSKPDPIDIVARTAWGEARGEGQDGMQAVINVVMNRARRQGWMGHDPISVCLKPWQFSCWNQDDPNRVKLLAVAIDDPQFRQALQLADNAVNGLLADITKGADSYADLRYCAPDWAAEAEFLVKVGNQSFYKTVA